IASQPQAAAWIVKEASERIPGVIAAMDIDVAAARPDSGAVLHLDPVQVVGRRCASSSKIIAYEPDARVCVRCERVYFKENVPTECACGANLEHLRPHAMREAPAAS